MKNSVSDSAVEQRPSSIVDEERVGDLPVNVPFPFIAILQQLGSGSRMERHQAGLVELSVSDLEVRWIFIQIDLGQFQPQGFADAQSRASK